MCVPSSCLGIRMHACLFKDYKEVMGMQCSKLCIYTYLTFHSLCDIRELQISCLLNKAKARKQCSTLIPTKIQV